MFYLITLNQVDGHNLIMKKKVLIAGIFGQDGTILSNLIKKDYDVIGVVRVGSSEEKIKQFVKESEIKIHRLDLLDYELTKDFIKSEKPEIIVNFAGHTDVISAWDDPKKTLLYNSLIPLHIMESIKNFSDEIFFFQASSSLMYSNSNEHIINENSKYSPLYPYGISKLQTHLLLNEYRKKYNLKCSSGIFFNHDSYYRNEKFLSKKVAKFVVSILNGKYGKLSLGDLNSYRDISHADDFMLGVEMIINNKINEDFIFSSGVSTKILDFVKLFFDFTNLDFEKYVTFEKKLIRDSDYNIIGDNSKLKSFGWVNNYDIKSLVSNMIQDEIENYKNIDTLT